LTFSTLVCNSVNNQIPPVILILILIINIYTMENYWFINIINNIVLLADYWFININNINYKQY
jgi:hypothetical protein